MRYKIMVKGAAYKAARTAKLYTVQIYRAVSLTLRIKMPDGTPLKGQTININGTDMATGTNGQVILTGDMGRTTKLHIVYNVTYIADVEVTYTAAAVYDVALEQHVVAGSVTVSEWAFSSTKHQQLRQKAVYVGRSAGCNRCQDDRLEIPLLHKNKSRLRRDERRGDSAWRR